MTIGNRPVGPPINIWNDHRTACRCATLAGSSSLPSPTGGARLAHPGVPPGRGTVMSGDGVHGWFILTHAYDRVDIPTGGRRHLPSTVPAEADPRSGRPGHHRRAGRSGHRSALSRLQAARAVADTEARRGIRHAVRARLRRPHPRIPHRGCRNDRRGPGGGGGDRMSSTNCANPESGLARYRSVRSGPSRRRCARRCRRRSASSCWRNASP